MDEKIVLKLIKFQSHIGITEEERRRAQPMGVDLELRYPEGAWSAAAQSDDIAQAIDYAMVVQRVVEVGTAGKYQLLERLAEEILRMVFAEFAVAEAAIWLRKLVPPVTGIGESVGVRVRRRREDGTGLHRPAGFLSDHVHRLRRGHALDVAAGRGRNTLFLARSGFTVEAVDRDEQDLAQLRDAARARGLEDVTTRTIDLEGDPQAGRALSEHRYDVIVVFFYLHRPLFPALLEALSPGGHLVYETFLLDNHLRYGHPRRKEFCLERNELLGLANGLRIAHYDEGPHGEAGERDPAWTARLLAEKPTGS
jgi:dihydroneopterin aldolase